MSDIIQPLRKGTFGCAPALCTPQLSPDRVYFATSKLLTQGNPTDANERSPVIERPPYAMLPHCFKFLILISIYACGVFMLGSRRPFRSACWRDVALEEF
ncbi:unnamed protein product [Danaus chrysippus]|uniref:(African queen) hypothetical protein n=1 Tax=Danaus chrysippus TaxID=151541 RepID=A0A8J2R8C8_9NEOP|nr:unnamed protein product [Danaus chrysippus]